MPQSEPLPMPSDWPASGIRCSTKDRSPSALSAHSRDEISRFLAGARDVIAEVVADADRPTRPAPLVEIELVRVPRHDGRGHEWLDALRIVEASMPLRDIDGSEPKCAGCSRCEKRKRVTARARGKKAGRA